MPKRTYGPYESVSRKRRKTEMPKRTQYGQAKRFHRYRFGLNQRTGGFRGMELKFYDTSVVANALIAPTDASGGEHNPSGSVTLNTVAQNTSETGRIGRQIKMHSISIKGIVTVPPQTNQTLTDTHPEIFIAVVLDKQVNGALLNSEDVFKNITANAIGATSLFRNLEFIQRFKVLAVKRLRIHDQTIVWDGANLEQAGAHIAFDLSAKLKGMIVNFCGTTSDVANIVDNGLNLIAFTSNVNFLPHLTYGSRLRFTG